MSSDVYPSKDLVDKQHPRLLSQQVADEIRQRIVSGLCPPHFKLSSEPELAAEFGVSRGTLRVAVQDLVNERLLTRVHGRGTFVTAGGGEELSLARLTTMSEVFLELHRPFEVQVICQGVEPGTAQIRKLLGMGRNDKLFRLRRRFLIDGEPHAVVENRLAVSTCPDLQSVDFTRETLFGSLGSLGVTIAWGRRTFSAVADSAVAAELLTDPSAPLLHIEQIAYDSASRPIEQSDTWARGDRLRLTTVLGR
jgi:GntR family transcriptional regulator